MKMIVGLGNPGKQYEHTRHNVGFDVVEEVARRAGVAFRKGFLASAQTAKAKVAGIEVLLVKPLTYMNRSGHAVRALMKRRGWQPEDVAVVLDDADLEPGRLRIRKSGSAGGHKGLKSVLEELASENVARVRIGIGRDPSGRDMVDHVLTRFTAEERKLMEDAVKTGADAVAAIVESGVDKAMNTFN